ncbi:MAG: response regulator [Spirochaetales bacterium]|nr:response regulator [Spirochaetales bacterium]
MKILILDDEIISAMGLEIKLKNIGFTSIFKTSRYDDAMKIYKQEQPDVIILDININESRSGLEFAKNVNSKTSIVFVSGYRIENYIEELKDVKYDLYLEKPILFHQLEDFLLARQNS